MPRATKRAVLGPATLAAAAWLMAAVPADAGGGDRRDDGPVVRYVSAGHVYLDAGADGGLAAGDTVEIYRKDLSIATAVIDYVSRHSSTCVPIRRSDHAPEKGDTVIVVGPRARRGTRPLSPPPAGPSGPPLPPGYDGPMVVTHVWPKHQDARSVRSVETFDIEPRPVPRVRLIEGVVSLEWIHIDDRTVAGLDLDRPTARIRLAAPHLLDDSYAFEMRGRFRRIDRSRSYGSGTHSSEWRNRLYTLSLSRTTRENTFRWKAGRIVPDRAGGAGTLDGVLVETGIGRAIRTGAFAGTLPTWRDSDPRTAVQKGGVYIDYRPGDVNGRRLDGTVAAVGEYRGNTTSREYLYLRSAARFGRRFRVEESAIVDVNRSWRKDVAPSRLSLSRLYLTGRFRGSNGFEASFTGYSRKRYRTYESRSTADSLFDGAARAGGKLRIGARLLRFHVSLEGGARERGSGGGPVWTWSAAARSTAVGTAAFGASLRVTGYSGALSSGVRTTLRLSASPAPRADLSLGWTGSFYTLDIDGKSRSDHTLIPAASLDLGKGVRAGAIYERHWGDDRNENRVIIDIDRKI